MAMGYTLQECCFYRRSGKLANSVHGRYGEGSVLYWDGIFVLLGAGFLLSLDIPL